MTRACAACGAANPHISIGGVLVCRRCDPIVRERIGDLTAEGKRVDVAKIAIELFRAENSAGSYLLRDIPLELWQQAKHVAVDRGVSLRDLLLAGLRKEIG